MSSFLRPYTIALLIFVIFIQFLSVGYFVLGFSLKYNEKLFAPSILPVINQLKLGALPLGTTVDYITFSLASLLFIHAAVGMLGLVGCMCRNKIIIVVYAVLCLLCFLVEVIFLAIFGEINRELPGMNSTFNRLFEEFSSSASSKYRDGWNSMFNVLNCYGSEGPITVTAVGVQTRLGCFDKYRGTLTAYLEGYMIMIVLHLLCGVACVGIVEYIYRDISINRLNKKTKKDTVWDLRFGMLGELRSCTKRTWQSDKLVLFSTSCVVCFAVINIAFWIGLLILYEGVYSDEGMWSILYSIEKDGLKMGRMAGGLTVAMLVYLLLEELFTVFFFLGVYWRHYFSLGMFVAIQIISCIVDILGIYFTSYLVNIYLCCSENSLSLNAQCEQAGEVCRYRSSLRTFSWYFVGFTMVRLVGHVVQGIVSDRLYKSMRAADRKTADLPADRGDFQYPSGCIVHTSQQIWWYSRRYTLKAVTKIITVFSMIWVTTSWLGLITVHHGYEIHQQMQDNIRNISRNGVNMLAVDEVVFWFTVLTLPFVMISKGVLIYGVARDELKYLVASGTIDAGSIIVSIFMLSFMSIFLHMTYCCGVNYKDSCRFQVNQGFSLNDTEVCTSSTYLPTYTKIYTRTMVATLVLYTILMVTSFVLTNIIHKRLDGIELGRSAGASCIYKQLLDPLRRNIVKIAVDIKKNILTVTFAMGVLVFCLYTLNITFLFGNIIYFFIDLSSLNNYLQDIHVYGYYGNTSEMIQGVVWCLRITSFLSLFVATFGLIGLSKNMKEFLSAFVLGSAICAVICLVLFGLSSHIIRLVICCMDFQADCIFGPRDNVILMCNATGTVLGGVAWTNFSMSFIQLALYVMSGILASLMLKRLISNATVEPVSVVNNEEGISAATEETERKTTPESDEIREQAIRNISVSKSDKVTNTLVTEKITSQTVAETKQSLTKSFTSRSQDTLEQLMVNTDSLEFEESREKDDQRSVSSGSEETIIDYVPDIKTLEEMEIDSGPLSTAPARKRKRKRSRRRKHLTTENLNYTDVTQDDDHFDSKET